MRSTLTAILLAVACTRPPAQETTLTITVEAVKCAPHPARPASCRVWSEMDAHYFQIPWSVNNQSVMVEVYTPSLSAQIINDALQRGICFRFKDIRALQWYHAIPSEGDRGTYVLMSQTPIPIDQVPALEKAVLMYHQRL